jgi:hypothetical protein
MGYRSDVVLMAVFANAEQHDEVMSVYRMNPKVQEHKLEEAWRRVDMDSGEVVRIYEGENVKWYESYEDVIALNELSALMDTFHEEREFGYAWGYARVGEEDTDIEYEVNGAGDNDLKDVVYENLNISRSVALDI